MRAPIKVILILILPHHHHHYLAPMREIKGQGRISKINFSLRQFYYLQPSSPPIRQAVSSVSNVAPAHHSFPKQVLTEKHKLPLLPGIKPAYFTRYPNCTWNQIAEYPTLTEAYYVIQVCYFQPKILRIVLLDILWESQKVFLKT